MRRRDFVIGGGAALARPAVTQAQPGERMRRLGILSGTLESDFQASNRVVIEALRQRGWIEGTNLLIDARSVASSTRRGGQCDRFFRFCR